MVETKIAVDIQDLSKTVKGKTLVQRLDYQLEAGKILALCGGNGAGKSTVIRLITGLMEPTTGHVMLHGLQRKQDKTKFTSQFGYMPDDFLFQNRMSAWEILRFYAKLKHVDKARAKAVLKEVGLAEVANEKVGKFSKGMRQRLLLAQALLANPNILILDEPTNGLDPAWIRKFSNLMLAAKKKGQTVIFSTHELAVAEKTADEVMFLRNGEVMSSGPIENYRDVGLYEAFQRLNEVG